MQGLGGIIYGVEGIGKTSLALEFPGPITCLSVKESGYIDLELIKAVPPDSINYTIDNYEELVFITQKIDKGTVIIDSMSGVQKMLFDYVCRTSFNNDWDKFTDFYKGPRQYAPPELDRLFDMIDIRRASGINYILIAHSIVKDQPNALGANYLSYIIDMDEGVRASTMKWASFILFLSLSIDITRATERDRATKIVLEGKAKEDDNRLIYTTKSPGHSAKNRWNLPSVIAMGSSPREAFTNLWRTLPEPIQQLSK